MKNKYTEAIEAMSEDEINKFIDKYKDLSETTGEDDPHKLEYETKLSTLMSIDEKRENFKDKLNDILDTLSAENSEKARGTLKEEIESVKIMKKDMAYKYNFYQTFADEFLKKLEPELNSRDLYKNYIKTESLNEEVLKHMLHLKGERVQITKQRMQILRNFRSLFLMKYKNPKRSESSEWYTNYLDEFLEKMLYEAEVKDLKERSSELISKLEGEEKSDAIKEWTDSLLKQIDAEEDEIGGNKNKNWNWYRTQVKLSAKQLKSLKSSMRKPQCNGLTSEACRNIPDCIWGKTDAAATPTCQNSYKYQEDRNGNTAKTEPTLLLKMAPLLQPKAHMHISGRELSDAP
jgi:hypothetical protein